MAHSNNDIENWLSLEQFFIELTQGWFEENFEDGGFSTPSREGIFSPALTIWLMLLQRFKQRRTLVGALENLIDGDAQQTLDRNDRSKKIQQGDISANTGGFCRARQRLSLEQVISIAELIGSELTKQNREKGLWRGRAAYLIDGTMITLPRTQSILKDFPTHTSGDQELHCPQIRCLCMHNVETGIAINPVYGAYRGGKGSGEPALAKEMLAKHKDPSIIIGDRGFGLFSTAYHAAINGHEVLFRLSISQAEMLLGRSIGDKDIDRQVTWWAKPYTLQNNPEIPKNTGLKGRFIRKTVRRRGFRPLVLFFFTTCPEPPHLLAKLYGKRERIENDIRSLKHTLGMEMLYARTSDMTQKELVLGVAAYNLLRACLAVAAKKLGLEPRQISFSRGAELTRIFGNKIRLAESQNERHQIIEKYLVALKQSKLPNRARHRTEPRKVVRNKKRYPLMSKLRKLEREIILSSGTTKT